MNDNNNEVEPETSYSVGPETATRDLIVSLGRKVLSDIVLGFSVLTIIGILQLLQANNDSIFLFLLESFTTAALSVWLISLILSVTPDHFYERINTIDGLSVRQVGLILFGIALWYGTFFLVSRFVASTVEGLNALAGK